MGWFDGSSSHKRSHSRDSKKHHHSSKHRHSSPSIFGGDSKHDRHHSSSRSIFGGSDHHKHNKSTSSFFSLGGDHHSKHNSSRSSFFGGDPKRNSSRSSFFAPFGGNRSSSYYKRSPRGGFVKRIYSKLRHLLRDLIYYMKRHPMKVFMLVIMPLITGGALTGLLAKFGLRMPASLQKMFGAAGGGAGMGGGGARGWERSSMHAEGPLDAVGGIGGAMNAMGGIGSAVKMAKMFM